MTTQLRLGFLPQASRHIAKLSVIAALVAGALMFFDHPASAEGDACVLPGVTVVVDTAGDQGPGGSQYDIRSISIAELGADTNTLTFSMKVTDLSSLPANGNWRTVFTAPNGATYYVGMETDESAAVAYTYGTVSGSSSATLGPADAGSYSSEGIISIKIANSKTGTLGAGSLLNAVHGETSLLAGALGTGLLVLADNTADGTYTLAGNAACAGGTPTPTPTPTATPSPTATPPAADGTWTKYEPPMPVERDAATMRSTRREVKSFSSAGTTPTRRKSAMTHGRGTALGGGRSIRSHRLPRDWSP